MSGNREKSCSVDGPHQINSYLPGYHLISISAGTDERFAVIPSNIRSNSS